MAEQQGRGLSARLVDTTMLYAPQSGGVKRYLSAKREWIKRRRPLVRHMLVAPGARDAVQDDVWSIYTAPLPFGAGYRWPVSRSAWMRRLIARRPSLIEAGDPYTPGLAALRAGQVLGVPVIGFCHTDLPALASLHFGEWAERPVRNTWARIYRQFDRVVAPSLYVAARLRDAGVDNVVGLPLGVDVATFSPRRGDREGLRRRLGLAHEERLLVFAGRPAREKRLDVLVEAVERLGAPYRLLFVGAGAAAPPSDRTVSLPYEREPAALARLLASCDAFVHANDAEPFGLVVLEAMACGLPVVGVATGGVAESVDDEVGRLAAASSAVALAEAVEALFERDVEAVGLAARRRAVDRHGWDRVFERLTGIYAEQTGDMSFTRSAAEEHRQAH